MEKQSDIRFYVGRALIAILIFTVVYLAFMGVRLLRTRESERAFKARMWAEPITRFESEVRILPGGALLVSEAIAVQAKGQMIRRGLRRGLSLTFKDGAGAEHSAKYEYLGVLLDGSRFPLLVDRVQNMDVVDLRQPAGIAPGDHLFQLQYKTEHRVQAVGSREELVYDVTGGWRLIIARAAAVVRLPELLLADAVDCRGMIAPSDDPRRAVNAPGDVEVLREIDPERKDTGVITLRTTRPLELNEHFIIHLAWPAGFAYKPS